MKPLKIKNEVGSNMKSTIRYTFVLPGAIRKGYGRGLKSLSEKRNMPTKSLLPPSSDVVKQYINDIETSSIVKDQGQGLKTSIMSTSQRMRMIHKNPMDSEKENKQINTLSLTSISQVKKYTQEVEIIKISLSLAFPDIAFAFGFRCYRNETRVKSWTLNSSLGVSEYEARSSRNATNRAKLKLIHHIGSKPIQEIIYQKLLSMF